MDFPYLQEEEIEAAAKDLLGKAFGAAEDVSLPVDLDVIAYDYLYDHEGVAFRDDRRLGAKDGNPILGITQPRGGKIFVDADLKDEGPAGRYRFTVAHEMGHWVLHEPLFARDEAQGSLFEDGHGQDDELVSLERNVFPDVNRGRLPPEEWQANRFAIALLLDRERLRDAFRARFDEAYVTPQDLEEPSTSVGCRRAARRLASREVGTRRPLNELFGLSVQAMAIALEKRGYVRRAEAAL